MKFRAKRLDHGELVEGYYVFRGAKKHQIVTDENLFPLEIDPTTLAMSTGVTDKNGTMIFGSVPVDGEMSKGGDIVQCTGYYYLDQSNTKNFNYKAAILYRIESCAFCAKDIDSDLEPPMMFDLLLTYDKQFLITGKQYEHGSE